MTSWSPQQEAAIKAVTRWARADGGPQVFRLFGYAGTGKTTLATEMAENVAGKVCFAAFTGKAALMMRGKGCRNACTLHSLIYKVEEDGSDTPTFSINDESKVRGARVVVIDECSMVDEALGRDLLRFGVKVLVLGDPAQLPPVKGAGFFTAHEPDVMLTEVHRQARDNPIIRMSMDIREGHRLEPGPYGDSVVIRRADLDPSMVTGADQVLVGQNATRKKYNGRIRELKGFDAGLPVVGDRLICLRNDRKKGLLNGGLWSVDKVKKTRGKRADPAAISLDLSSLDAGAAPDVSVRVLREYFNGTEDGLTWHERRGYDDFTFGYAITVHKSQGSQWDRVCLFDESAVFGADARRHLYTGVTRAAKQVTVVM